MPTYAIGDIQGCYQTLIKLLNRIEFNPDRDQLWVAGDLINRGNDSLKTLSFLYQLDDSVKCVLGNHDLHFLAVESGASIPRPKDTLDGILESPLREKLVNWLASQPLFHRDQKLNFAMTHAGFYPGWTLEQTEAYAKEVSDVLQSTDSLDFYLSMYGNTPEVWDEKLEGVERLRFITNALTRMRFCSDKLKLDLEEKSSPAQSPSNLLPWFELISSPKQYSLLFGHWASLEGYCPVKRIYALDTGCVWGGQLSALRLEDRQWFRVNSIE